MDDAAETGVKASINKELQDVYATPDGRDMAAEAILGVYAGLRANGAGIGSALEQATKLVTGGIVLHNGGKITQPYGWEMSEFRDWLYNTAPDLLKGSFTIGNSVIYAEDLGKMLPGAKLQSSGRNSYVIKSGNETVRTKDGRPFVLRVF